MGFSALVRIWKEYMSRHRTWFLLGFLFIACTAVMYALEVYMVKFIFDDLLNPNADFGRPGSFLGVLRRLGLPKEVQLDRGDLFTIIPLALVLIFLIKGFFGYFGKFWMDSVGLSTITDLREALYDRILRQGLDFFAAYPTGTLISRLLNDIERMKTAVSEKLTEISTAVFSLLALATSALLQNWRLTLVSFVTIPMVVYPLARFSRKLRKASQHSQEHMAHLANQMKESVTGIQIVKVFQNEERERKRFGRFNKALLKENLRATRIMSLTTPLMECIGGAAVAGILYYGHFKIMSGQASMGSFSAFLATLYAMYVPVKKLSQANNILQQAVAAAERSVELLDRDVAVVEADDPEVLTPFSKSIAFDGVSFAYEEGSPVLRDVALEVAKGETIAIVGPSGSGKTTLVNLLPRLYDPVEGRVAIDGRDIRKVTLESLRRQIGMVTQLTVLFDGTVAENIAYGAPDATSEQVRAAAEQALAAEFIEEMPDGLNTPLGEGGFALSGGQRQRLSIARALLKNPPILILDEATSALDSESEYWVQQALFNLLKGRTTLVIAHRLATILNADRIVVLEKGRLAAAGSHEELLGRSDLYAQLCEREFRTSEGLPRK